MPSADSDTGGGTRLIPPGDQSGERSSLTSLSSSFPPRSLSPDERTELDKISAAKLDQYLQICLGIESRNIHHPGNEEATDALAAALAQICGGDCTSRPLAGENSEEKQFCNIEAVIPGESDQVVIVGAHFDSTADRAFGGGPYSYSAADISRSWRRRRCQRCCGSPGGCRGAEGDERGFSARAARFASYSSTEKSTD